MPKAVKTTYELNHKKVLKEEFENFLRSLKGEENWTCKIISGGGVTTYLSRDSKGQLYNVLLQSGTENKKIISKK